MLSSQFVRERYTPPTCHRRNDRRTDAAKRDQSIDGSVAAAGAAAGGLSACGETGVITRRRRRLLQSAWLGSYRLTQLTGGRVKSAALKRTRRLPNGWPRHCGRKPRSTTCPLIDLHVERRRLALQVLLADQIPGQERRSGLLILRQHAAREAFRASRTPGCRRRRPRPSPACLPSPDASDRSSTSTSEPRRK